MSDDIVVPITLTERHKAFLNALAEKDRDGAMNQVQANGWSVGTQVITDLRKAGEI